MRTDIAGYLNWSYFQMLCLIHPAPELTVMVAAAIVLCHYSFYWPAWIFVADADAAVVVVMMLAVGVVQFALE